MPLTAAPISRRGFLRASAATTAVILGASAAAGCASSGRYDALIRDEHPEVLSAKELAILIAVADRVITPAEGGPTAREARIARRIDRELVFCDGRLTGDVRAALSLIEYGPLLDLHLRRFTGLTPAAQDAYLEACRASGWTLRRNAFNGLRFLCLFFYYTDDRTFRSVGYSGPMVDRKLPEAPNAIETLDRPIMSARA